MAHIRYVYIIFTSVTYFQCRFKVKKHLPLPSFRSTDMLVSTETSNPHLPSVTGKWG